MILGALLSAGLEKAELERSLTGLTIPQLRLESKTVSRSGLASVHVEVVAPDQSRHRHLPEIEKIINSAGLSETVKARSVAIFRRLAEAEAKVHGIGIDKVHFHEVGALDAIVDVVGCCIGFEMLSIERFVCSRLNTGSGFVRMDHGTFPVPPPAVSELVSGRPIYSNGVEGELLTPTGAAIVTTVSDTYGPLPQMTIENVGYGAGTRDHHEFPNVLRIFIGEGDGTGAVPTRDQEDEIREKMFLLETNLDDLSPQVVSYAAELAFQLGAADCWTTPIQMKKGRQGVQLSVLCTEDRVDRLLELVFVETSSLGVRVASVDRRSLPRELVSVATAYGDVHVKSARLGGKTVNVMPEYEDVRKAARESGVPFAEVWDAAKLGLSLAESETALEKVDG